MVLYVVSSMKLELFLSVRQSISFKNFVGTGRSFWQKSSYAWHTVVIHSSFRNVNITSFHLFDVIVPLNSCTIGQANVSFTYSSMEQVPKYLVINSIIKTAY